MLETISQTLHWDVYDTCRTKGALSYKKLITLFNSVIYDLGTTCTLTRQELIITDTFRLIW